jgi:cell wall-associated NlpC family hydrolase
MVLVLGINALRNRKECGMLDCMQTKSPRSDISHYRGSSRALPVVAHLAALALFSMLLAACGSHPVRHNASHASRLPPIVFIDVPTADSARANDVLIRAIGLVGTPYKWGGNTPEGGFDCSGLVNFVYRDMGRLNLPRTSRELAAMPIPDVRDNRLAPGDLLLFGDGNVNHVGIYVGQGRFVHAPNSGGTVRLDEINGWYWREHYLGARRVLR